MFQFYPPPLPRNANFDMQREAAQRDLQAQLEMQQFEIRKREMRIQEMRQIEEKRLRHSALIDMLGGDEKELI